MNDAARLALVGGLFPNLTDTMLCELYRAVKHNDHRLVQGITVYPRPMVDTSNARCQCACLIAYPSWKGLNLQSVCDVENAFVEQCDAIRITTGDEYAVANLLAWYDDTPMDDVLTTLLTEVSLEMFRRKLTPTGV